jgi:hypothetical protein
MSRARDTANQINRVNSSAADATAITVDSSERVMIGTSTSSSSSNVKLLMSGSSGAFTQYSHNGGAGSVVGTPDASTLAFYTYTGNIGAETYTERLRIDSDGLKFHGDTAAANALNDYEEGTWTPTIIGSSSAGTMTYPDRVGRYQKVGRLVTIHFYIQGNSGSGSGNLLVGGVPFTIANYHLGYGSPQWNNGITYPSGAIDANYLRNSSTTFDIRCNKSNAAFANVQYPTTPDYLRGCITYETTQ